MILLRREYWPDLCRISQDSLLAGADRVDTEKSLASLGDIQLATCFCFMKEYSQEQC
jgi:hypothetical protein